MLSGFVRSNNGKAQVAPLDDNQRMTFTERLNARGTFELDVGYDTVTAQALNETTGPGVLLFFGAETVFSGHATAIRRRDSDVLTVVGINDTGLLGDRIVEPDPVGLTIALQAYDVQTGSVTEVLSYFIDQQMGPGAHADRRLADFILATDPDLGPDITINGRFQQLDELVAKHCNANGLAYRALQNNSNQIVGEFRAQTLVGGEVFATEGFNTVSFDSSAKAATATYALAAGQGEGTARITVRSNDPMTGRFAGRRIETFLDQRSEDDPAVLANANAEALVDTSETISLKVELFGDQAFDYVVGDIAPVQIDGVRFELPIFETKTILTPDSISRELSIGDRDGDDANAGVARIANRSSNRIRNIERI